MTLTVLTYIVYLVLSVGMCVWVAQTLYSNGRVFLIDVFHGKEDLADSINHLLVVGFYLVNLGYIAMWLKVDQVVGSTQGVFEAVSWKVGIVLMVLGMLHFANLYVFSRIRRAGSLKQYEVDDRTKRRPPLPSRKLSEARDGDLA